MAAPGADAGWRSQPAGQGGLDFLRIESIRKSFGDQRVVDDVSLVVRRDEIFALLGPSGCGKSTLLRIVAGLERADAGRIVLDGEDLAEVPSHRRPTNMMFQSYALFPHLTVAGNVAFGLKQLKPRMAAATLRQRVDEMLDMVQLKPLARRRPHELSGGQQQRVALARSLAREPKLLLLDEPLSALDKKIRQRTQLELVGLVRRVGVSCIMVTHDQEEAMTMADRIGVMSPRGALLQVAAPGQIYERPSCRYTAEFIGETNLFAGRIRGGKLESPDFPRPIVLPPASLPGAAPGEGDECWLSVRPERLWLHAGPAAVAHDNVASGVVAEIAYLGSHSIYHLAVAGARALIVSVASAHWGESSAPARGEAVTVSWSGPDGVVLRA